MPWLHRLDPRDRPLHEAIVDFFVNQRARRAGADLALVEGEHREAFERLVEKIIVLRGDILEEDVGRLAAEFQRHRNDIFRRILHDEAARRRLAGEGDLGDPLALRQRLAGLDAEAIDDIEDAGRQKIADHVHEDHDAHRRLLGRLQHDAIAGGERGRELPDRHQEREIPRDDLRDDAERLVEMIGDRIMVDLADAAFLRPNAAGEIAEMIDRQRQIGALGFADRLAVVDRLDEGEKIELLLDPVGDAQKRERALRRRRAPPGLPRGMRGIEGEFDILGGRAGDRADHVAVDRAKYSRRFGP